MLKDKGFQAVLALKLILLAVFSSCYQNSLFIPFVSHFIDNLDNPWQYFYSTGSAVEFPYHPVMLYVLSLFYLPVKLLHLHSTFADNLFFKAPTLLADVLVAWLLLRLFPGRRKEVLIFYFASPIILYACDMHSQIDLLPTALLFLAVYFLTRRKMTWSAVVMGLAVCMKLHVLAALPLMIVYIFRNARKRDVLIFPLTILAVYSVITTPYLFSDGFHAMVLSNKKQSLLFDTLFSVSQLSLYLPIFAAFLVYMRFAFYDKINNDLFYTFMGILFSMFILLVYPSPGWYVWILPFLSAFFIKQYSENKNILLVHGALGAAYIAFFLFFHIPEFCELICVRAPIDLKIYNPVSRNISYTLLETTLFGTIYSLYRFGVRSNSIYRKQFATIIGIGGDSGSGKSTLLADTKALLGSRLLELEGDGYHKWDRDDLNWQKYTHLDPKANFLHRQTASILALKVGKFADYVDYDHATGRFTNPRKVEPKEFIILCGLHTFYLPLARKLMDIKIYMDTDDRVRRHWKVVRDVKERGYDREKALAQIDGRAGDADKYIYPQREYADIIIRYFSDEDFDIGDTGRDPLIKLEVRLGADFHIEDLVNKLITAGVEMTWDYADDLKSQFIILNRPPDAGLLRALAGETVANMEELVTGQPVWADGYRGFIQILLLIALSEKIKEANVSSQL